MIIKHKAFIKKTILSNATQVEPLAYYTQKHLLNRVDLRVEGKNLGMSLKRVFPSI
jgi:hypothetical protein